MVSIITDPSVEKYRQRKVMVRVGGNSGASIGILLRNLSFLLDQQASLPKPLPNGNPFPTPASTHRSEDSLNPDTSRLSECDFGFQQRMVRFDEEPPKPPSVSKI